MPQTRHCLLIVLSLLTLAACGGSSSSSSYSTPAPEPAAEPAKPTLAVTQTMMSEVKITALDVEKRMLTLEAKDGRTLTTRVADDVGDMDKLKVGDIIDIEVTESVVLQVTKDQPLSSTVSVNAAQGRGTLAAEEVINIKARIVAIDSATRKVTFELDDGTRNVLLVDKNDPNFEQLKVGDVVDATIRMSVALALRRKAG